MIDLGKFLLESNRIEGIVGVREIEIEAAEKFLKLARVEIGEIEFYVSVVQPGARLRGVGNDVRVGSYTPPRGGPHVHLALHALVEEINAGKVTPWQTHVRYEMLHPFDDGNGRSGRIIWLWQMLKLGRSVGLGFLHQFYYQTLAAQES